MLEKHASVIRPPLIFMDVFCDEDAIPMRHKYVKEVTTLMRSGTHGRILALSLDDDGRTTDK